MTRAVVLAVVLFASGRAAAAQVMTPAEYGRVIGHAAQALEDAAASDQDPKPLAKAALEVMPKHAEVRSDTDGRTIKVDNTDLIRALRGQVTEGRAGIRTAAGVLRNLERNMAVESKAPPADARGALERVLQRREFRPSALDKARAWFNRLAMRALLGVSRAIAYLFTRLHLPGIELPLGWQRFIVRAILVLCGVVAFILVVRLVMRLPLRRARSLPVAPQPLAAKSHGAWLADAEAALKAQDYRAAVRALHMAALMKLDEAGHIRYVDSRTDGRFTRALRQGGRHDLADTLSSLSTVFAAVWYGMRPAGPGEYTTAEAQWRQLEALAGA
ncbi:MAG: DUF4129 domain-containing protein [Armatimonadota bacterium]|nr:MAG: DUF4129 domain-containing protein [Armatimonadota bacterium]